MRRTQVIHLCDLCEKDVPLTKIRVALVDAKKSFSAELCSECLNTKPVTDVITKVRRRQPLDEAVTVLVPKTRKKGVARNGPPPKDGSNQGAQ
jgi:hypothetical protein